MGELKTLKDIPIDAGKYDLDETHNIEKNLQVALKWKEELRQAAIKHIKKWKRELEVQYEEYDDEIIPNEPLCSELKAKIESFIEFFNISESEIK